MVAKNQIISELASIIACVKMELQSKNELGLTDDNKFWENIIRTILNMSFGYNLTNLNEKQMNYPGIDLGDYTMRLGVQVTVTKTGTKVKDTLDTVFTHKVYESFPNIKIFILGEKQGSYSVDFSVYHEYFLFSADNILDFSDLLNQFYIMETSQLMPILAYLRDETNDIFRKEEINDSEKRMAIVSLKTYLNLVFEAAQYMEEKSSIVRIDFKEEYLEHCKSILDLLDDISYESTVNFLAQAKQLAELTLKYSTKSSKYQEWDLIKCICIILQLGSVRLNIEELAERVTYNKNGFTKIMDILIDGTDFLERVSALEIDKDIVEKQFILSGLKSVIEMVTFRKCGTVEIWFDATSAVAFPEAIRRMRLERGVYVEIGDTKLKYMDRLKEHACQNKDFVLICKDESYTEFLRDLRVAGSSFYGIALGDDLPSSIINQCYNSFDIARYIKKCFEYNEEVEYNIKTLTLEQFREMIANGDDSHSNQIRVWPNGDVYLSKKTGAEDIEGLQFRWETFVAGNGYVGPKAASRIDNLKETYEELKSDWAQGRRGYLDY